MFNIYEWCRCYIPATYDNSLTVIELLCRILKYIQESLKKFESIDSEITDINAQIENVIKDLNSMQDEITNKLSDEYLMNIIKPLITEGINKMIESGTIVVSSRWLIDYPQSNTTAVLPQNASYGVSKSSFMYGKGVRKGYLANMIDVNLFYKLWDMVPNNPYVVKVSSGDVEFVKFAGTATGSFQPIIYDVLELGDEIEIKFDASAYTSGQYKVGIGTGDCLVYWSGNDNAFMYETNPSWTPTELQNKEYASKVFTLKLVYLSKGKYVIYINGERTSTISFSTPLDSQVALMFIRLYNDNDSVTVKYCECRSSVQASIKDVSYVTYMDGTPFIANGKAYFTCVSETYDGGLNMLCRHTPGCMDFEFVQSLPNTENLKFDPVTKQFVNFAKDWAHTKIGYGLWKYSGGCLVNSQYITPFNETSDIDVFGTSSTAEDVDCIRFGEYTYIAYCVQNEESVFITKVFRTKNTGLDFNSYEWELYATINENSTGLKFIAVNATLYIMYGSTNGLKIYDFNAGASYDIPVNVDTRVWANIIPVNNGDKTIYYGLTFDRTLYGTGRNSYGNVVVFRSLSKINTGVSNNVIGIR